MSILSLQVWAVMGTSQDALALEGLLVCCPGAQLPDETEAAAAVCLKSRKGQRF